MRRPCFVQCAIDRVGLRPAAGQDWLHDGQVAITSSNAADFSAWWRVHDTPGPYPETFVIDGHRTHYLAFGATWVKKNGQWVPQHAARTDPVAEQESLDGWATWSALTTSFPRRSAAPRSRRGNCRRRSSPAARTPAIPGALDVREQPAS